MIDFDDESRHQSPWVQPSSFVIRALDQSDCDANRKMSFLDYLSASCFVGPGLCYDLAVLFVFLVGFFVSGICGF